MTQFSFLVFLRLPGLKIAMALPPLADFLQGSRTRLSTLDLSSEDENNKNDEVPSAPEVARLYKRALDAHNRVRLSVPKAQRDLVVSWMDHFEVYGKASCRHLCQDLCDRLPRELRDIVYGYLLSPGRRDVSAAGGSDCEPIHARNQAHFWRPEYAGKQMITELLETWYKCTRVHLGLDIGFLESFLLEKVDYLDVPRHRVISKISITLDRRDLASYKYQLQTDEIKSFSLHKRLLGRLEAFFLLRDGASIHIYPYRPNSWIEVPDIFTPQAVQKHLLRDATTPIFDCLQRLKSAGYFVTIAIGDKPLYSWSQDVQLYHLETEYDADLYEAGHYVEGEGGIAWRKGVIPCHQNLKEWLANVGQ